MKRVFSLFIVLILMAGTQIKAQPGGGRAPGGAPGGAQGGTQAASATAASVINYSSLEKKLTKSNSLIQNAKQNVKVKTWTDRASLLVDIANIYNNVLYNGMDATEARLFVGNPKEIQTSVDGGDKMENYVYDRVTLTFRSGTLESWTETNKIVQNPLADAKSAILKAIELNKDGKADNTIAKAITSLKNAYEAEAVNEYNKNNLETAYNHFSEILNLNALPVMKNVVDTVIIYNAGRTAIESKKYAEAVKHFSTLESMNYDEPFLYVYLKQALFGAGDTARGAQMINKGFEKYPDNQSIMIELINYYLLSNQSDQALKLLGVAKAKDPENVSFVFAEGTLYDRINDFDNAERVYKECLEMDENFYDAAYNLGVLYYNRAVRVYEQASLTSDNALFQKLDAEGDSWLRKAIPYMELASKLDPTDRYSLESLRNMYSRLEMNDKYQETVKKLQTM